MKPNPIVEVMERLGLTESSLAFVAGMTRPAIVNMCEGQPRRPPGRVLLALRDLDPNMDWQRLEAEYVAWRAENGRPGAITRAGR